jgi:hypothetical protein
MGGLAGFRLHRPVLACTCLTQHCTKVAKNVLAVVLDRLEDTRKGKSMRDWNRQTGQLLICFHMLYVTFGFIMVSEEYCLSMAPCFTGIHCFLAKSNYIVLQEDFTKDSIKLKTIFYTFCFKKYFDKYIVGRNCFKVSNVNFDLCRSN